MTRHRMEVMVATEFQKWYPFLIEMVVLEKLHLNRVIHEVPKRRMKLWLIFFFFNKLSIKSTLAHCTLKLI